MPKKSIFVKIYLCFWLVTVLVVAAQIGLDRLTRPHASMDDRLRDALTPLLTEYGHRAIEYHGAGDDTSLGKAADQLKRSTGIDAYLLDGTGREVNGRPLSEEVGNIAVRAGNRGRAEFSFSGKRALFALPVKDRAGNSYFAAGNLDLAAFDSHHPPPPGLLMNPPLMPLGGGPPPPFLLGPGPPPRQSTILVLLRWVTTLAISGGVCFMLARYLTAPVLKLRDATRRFAGGELTTRIGPDSGRWKDELSQLAEDFDLMAERMSALLSQQRQLMRDISHELRSPLTRLTIAIELLRRQSTEQAAPALDRIEKEAILLNHMIGQALAISRLESNVEALDAAPVDIARLLEEIAEDADFEAGAGNRRVEVIETAPCILWGSEEWLRRAIENVVRNAVRYTTTGTTVDLRLGQVMLDSGPQVEISVRDHGSGVPEASLPHLFQPFYRVSSARERQTGGTGLGLAITERAVHLHHGSVAVSNASDGGLVVTIRLPLPSDGSKEDA
jgi:signal transduction histidine kinase